MRPRRSPRIVVVVENDFRISGVFRDGFVLPVHFHELVLQVTTRKITRVQSLEIFAGEDVALVRGCPVSPRSKFPIITHIGRASSVPVRVGTRS